MKWMAERLISIYTKFWKTDSEKANLRLASALVNVVDARKLLLKVYGNCNEVFISEQIGNALFELMGKVAEREFPGIIEKVNAK